jgi:hypothetical protein
MSSASWSRAACRVYSWTWAKWSRTLSPELRVLAESLGEGEAQEVRGLDERAEGQGVEVAPPHGGAQEAIEVG